MKLIKTLALSAACILASTTSIAENQPNWGNPYDLWVGGVTYYADSGLGSGHHGTHGNTVTGPDYSTCNQRLQNAINQHSGETQLSYVGCYVQTTVVHVPQIVAPDLGSGNGSGNGSGDGSGDGTGATTVDYEVAQLKEKYDFEGYNAELERLTEKYQIESFRSEYGNLCATHITDPNRDEDEIRKVKRKSSYCRISITTPELGFDR